MSRGKDMNVIVMDVEGTDGREHDEYQVRRTENPQLNNKSILIIFLPHFHTQDFEQNRLYSRLPRPRSSSLTYENIKLDYTKARISVYSILFLKLTLGQKAVDG
jgi:hypothetical protein